MILKIRDGIIYNQDSNIVGTAPHVTAEVERAIEGGSEAIVAIEEFVENVNSGKYTPRAAVKKFEQILEKYPI